MKIDPNILNAFLTLMGSVALLGILLFVMKKFTVKFKNKSQENNIEILSKLNLSPKNSLWTIKVQDKILLLGISEKNINLLTELNEKTVIPKQNLSAQGTKKQVVNNVISKKESLNDDLSFKEFLRSAVFKNN